MKNKTNSIVAYRLSNGDIIHTKCRPEYLEIWSENEKKVAGIGKFNGIEAGIHIGHPCLEKGICKHCQTKFN